MWRTVHGDVTDAEWELVADVVPDASGGGRMGRPPVRAERDIVNAISYVTATGCQTGCQWRALPDCYPHWNTVHRCHLRWSRNGTWEKIVDRLRMMVREVEGRDAGPSAGVVDARSVRGASTVTAPTRGHDAGKKVSGRKCFGIVDTTGLLRSVVVLTAWASDNGGGVEAFERMPTTTRRLETVSCDGGCKRTFADALRAHHVTAEVVNDMHPGRFDVLPRRWVVERTWSWLMNNRRLQVDDERLRVVAGGFVWAAHSRPLLRRLTEGQRAA
jgi:putative transposase